MFFFPLLTNKYPASSLMISFVNFFKAQIYYIDPIDSYACFYDVRYFKFFTFWKLASKKLSLIQTDIDEKEK